MSESATKALHGGVGREKKRGISTIPFARSGSIRSFVADLDNRVTTAPGDALLCLRTWVTVLYQDIGDGSAGPGGDTRGLGLRGEPR